MITVLDQMYKKQKINYISADSHFCEPENFYIEKLPKKYLEEAPRYIEIKNNYFWTSPFTSSKFENFLSNKIPFNSLTSIPSPALFSHFFKKDLSP